MVEDGGGRRRHDREAALGGLLLLGVLVLAGQALELELGRVGWPVFVILPGLGLLGLGLTGQGRPGEVLAMAGGVVTMVGLVLGSSTPPTASRPGRTPGPCWWSAPGSDGGWSGSPAAAGTWPAAATG